MQGVDTVIVFFGDDDDKLRRDKYTSENAKAMSTSFAGLSLKMWSVLIF
jgi:hypothetical protein